MLNTKFCIIFDLDGTLADTRHRLHYIRQPLKNWSAFFDACVDDMPLAASLWLWNRIRRSLYAGEAMVICSGRPDSHRQETVDWLSQNGVNYDELKMRRTGDHRPDVIVKKEMLDEIRAGGTTVLFAVDDRPEVVRMWRANGVPVFQVDDAEWFADVEDRVTELLLKRLNSSSVVDIADLSRDIVRLFGRA